jgi:hypothetical protein
MDLALILLAIWIASGVGIARFLARKGFSPTEARGGGFVASCALLALLGVTLDLEKPAREAREAQLVAKQAAARKDAAAKRIQEEAEWTARYLEAKFSHTQWKNVE